MFEATYICMLWLHSGGSSLKFVEFACLSFASPMLPSRKNSGIMNDTQVYICIHRHLFYNTVV